MLKTLIGSVLGAIVMFVAGFILYATPLYYAAVGDTTDQQQATIQQSLAANLPETGTYHVPDGSTSASTVMYGQGPVAVIHYNRSGFPTSDPTMLLGGFIHYLVVALLIGVALAGLKHDGVTFADRLRTSALFAVAIAALLNLGQPIWYHLGWGHFVFKFIADVIVIVSGSAVISWFMRGSQRMSPDQYAADRTDVPPAPSSTHTAHPE